MARAPVRSPCEAAAAQRSNWSVTLAMALTTTTGCLPIDTRPATMEAVRLIAAGSSTDVPPNFMTTRLMPELPPFQLERCAEPPVPEMQVLRLRPPQRPPLRVTAERGRLHAGCGFGDRFKLAQAGQQLRVEDGRAGRAANGVVRHHGELPVQQSAGAETSDGYAHTATAIAVEPRLGTIFLGSKFDGLFGSHGQVLASQGTKFLPRPEKVLAGDGAAELVAQLDRHALGMPVFHCNAIAVRAHSRCQRFHFMLFEPAEQLERLGLHLFFFALDVGDHVAQDVHRRHAGIACAGDGLHGGHEDLLDPEAFFNRL